MSALSPSSSPVSNEKESSTSIDSRQFLIFKQDNSWFAIDLMVVREVLFVSAQPIAPVPNTRSFVLGLTNLRGEILAVADFGRSIGSTPSESGGGEEESAIDRHRRILVLEAGNPNDPGGGAILMGLVVSQVRGVFAIDPDRIVSAVEVSEELAPFVRGLYDWEGQLLTIVDVEAIAHYQQW
ncbi:chemotaxis protein CheW [Oxynema aestuarii]|jgi:purine-binding chemotaxis protein CheW|uniref:Purine-binding chemotaxis protein CheW n=1 Tax=Oxynema aestuarii AP17 TaxID=2064643 RepID=A0A6H1TXU2_9CYAN|nr:chemotaxis protein CheW [Oxynema aestuarii]QIZ71401.1 purine-binding chemotaxis protein CheW [Oxynema aestuarii AP17]RMH78303.1 MAG: purine-binding chemotaxis protein CheW [Cyanobacteria bacterium J007]